MIRASNDVARATDDSSGPAEAGANGDTTTLRGLSTAGILAELKRRERQLPRLLDRREKLLLELREVEREVASLQGTHRLPAVADDGPVALPANRVPREPKPKTRTKLGDAIANLVELHAFVVPKEALYLLKESGYPMTKSLPTRVAGTLATDQRFSRVERGKYERIR